MPLAFTSVADLLGDVLDELLPLLPEPQRDALSVALLLTRHAVSRRTRGRWPPQFLASLRALAQHGPVLWRWTTCSGLILASAATLAFALRRLRSEPVGFLLTRRTPSPSPLGLDRPTTQVTVTHQAVGPLSLAALQRLLRTRLGEVLPRPALRRVHDAAGGNPFFALELARALSGRWGELRPGAPLPVPEELHVLLRERLTGLAEPTLEALLRAALLAEPVVDRLDPSVRDALDPAVRAGVIVPARRPRGLHPPAARLESRRDDRAGSRARAAWRARRAGGHP